MRESAHTIVISDIHLGTSVSRVRELQNLLMNLSFQRLILLGDIVDVSGLHRLKKDDWSFIYFLRFLRRELGKDIILIRGNHDKDFLEDVATIIGGTAKKEYFWEYNNKQYIALHGDQFDRFLINNSLLNRIVPKFYFFMQFFNVRNKLFNITNSVAKKALRYAKEKDYDAIFCGHTHEAVEKYALEKDGRIISYYNTGCWTKARPTYVLISEHGIEIKKLQRSPFFERSWKKMFALNKRRETSAKH